jgi:hypothetical protein
VRLKTEESTSGSSNRHFRDEEWVDLARIQSDERRARLQKHLDEGCQECKRRLRFWTAVSRVAARETVYAPPVTAVRQVRGHYSPRSFAKRSAASLLFDSARELLPAGVRSAGLSARLLLYAKAGRVLKLRVESQTDSESFSLVGQVLEEKAPQRMLSDLPVLVQNGKRTVSRTLTNKTGEFALDLAPSMRLRLVIGLPGSEAMMVALPATAVVDDDA